MKYRVELDTMGEVRVPADKLWGAQTQRSIENFPIGEEKMPLALIRAIAMVKMASAMANFGKGLLSAEKASAINGAASEILEGRWDDMFPLSVWQTGSGTHTNMNVNEVIALLGNRKAGRIILHPNDDVNRSQSTNDVFPTAMHLSFILEAENRLFPAASKLASVFEELSARYSKICKTGRTHLQDAAPLTLGQEIGGWAASLWRSLEMAKASLEFLRSVPLGATAVGTGLNTVEGYREEAVKKLSEISGVRLHCSANLFQGISSKSELANAHSSIKTLAGELLRIANDIRLLASGPRSGIGEIRIPENEPGSSIMPGKVNPSQAEALVMVCVQAMANDSAISMAASLGNFQLNATMPLIIRNALHTIRILSDAIDSFQERCAKGIEPNMERIEENLSRSLMLATALNPYIGYDNAAKVAKRAFQENESLREAAIALGVMDGETFDRVVVAEKMTAPKSALA